MEGSGQIISFSPLQETAEAAPLPWVGMRQATPPQLLLHATLLDLGRPCMPTFKTEKESKGLFGSSFLNLKALKGLDHFNLLF